MNYSTHEFVKKTRESLREILPGSTLSGKKIIAGLSGGADSVSLLLALHAASAELGFELCACHVNHMIRGKEADRDEEFANFLCKKYGIPFYARRANVPEIAQMEKKGLEEAARDVRYRFFDELCSRDSCFIATAHTASDNAETVLMNILRGCGTAGLCGIPKKRGSIIRPILWAERRDVEAFLSDIGEDYVTDSTNLCDDCTRNIIRHSVIPQLTKLNPSFARTVSNLSALAKRDCSYLERTALENASTDIHSLAKADIALRSRIIGDMYRSLCGNMLDMKHTDMLCAEIEELAGSGSGEMKIFHLPGEIHAKIEFGKLSMLEADKNNDSTSEEYDIIAQPGINVLCGGEFIAVLSEINGENSSFGSILEYNKNIYSLFMEARLFSDIINSIRLRSGKDGDKIRISGMSKEVRKLYSAQKIPIPMRKKLPRICDSKSGEIIALPYTGVCDSQHCNTEMADISVRLYKLYNKE